MAAARSARRWRPLDGSSENQRGRSAPPPCHARAFHAPGRATSGAWPRAPSPPPCPSPCQTSATGDEAGSGNPLAVCSAAAGYNAKPMRASELRNRAPHTRRLVGRACFAVALLAPVAAGLLVGNVLFTLLATFFLGAAVTNSAMMLRSRRGTLIAFVGGLSGLVACLLAPWPWLRSLWWLPPLLDVGSLPLLLMVILHRLRHGND